VEKYQSLSWTRGTEIWSSLKDQALTLLVPLLCLLAWKFYASRLDNPVVLPYPETVLSIFFQPWKDVVGQGSLLQNMGISLARVLAGFFLAILVGVPVGLLMGYCPLLFKLFNGVLNFLRFIAPLAWMPLTLLWFGIASLATLWGIKEGPAYHWLHNIKLAMVFLIFISAFFPIWIESIHAAQSVDRRFIEAALVLGASSRDIFFKVLLPGAAPHIVNGIRVGLGIAWRTVISAEMIPGSLAGLGYLVWYSYSLWRTEVVLVGMAYIGIIGGALDLFFRWLAQRELHWFYRG